jgi:hypothetical protein
MIFWAANPAKYSKYLNRIDKAAGMIYNAVEDGQKLHLRGIEGDPVAMWKKLELVHLSKKPGMRFSSYDSLFSICLCPNEDLADLITCVSTAVAALQEQRPDKFTIQDLDDELHSMTLIRALPSDYNLLKDSLMILDDLNPATVSEALCNCAKNDEQRAENNDTSSAMTMAAKFTVARTLQGGEQIKQKTRNSLESDVSNCV